MATTTRTSQYLPIGTLKATANAAGTTTTLVGAAASVTLQIGEKFRLFTSADVPKENTTFTVTNRTGAGTITITFTPAASVATASTNSGYVPEVVDVNTALNNQMDYFDKAARAVVCTSSTRPSTDLFSGKLAYETDTSRLIGYNGSSWQILQGKYFSRGVMDFTSTTALGPTVGSGAESAITNLTCTFNATAGRKYLISSSVPIDAAALNEAECYLQARWASGASVSVSSTAVGRQAADYSDNNTGCVMRAEYAGVFTSNITGQVTVGMFFGRPAVGDGKSITVFNEYQHLFVEDVGAE